MRVMNSDASKREPKSLRKTRTRPRHPRISIPILGLCCGLVLFLLCTLICPSSGQHLQDKDIVQVKALLSHESIHPGEGFQVAVIANIEQGFHVNSHKPRDDYLIPTIVQFDTAPGILFGPVSYPIPELKSFSFSPTKLSVYEGSVVMVSQGKLSPNIPVETTRISGRLTYQACNDEHCLMPKTITFEMPLKVVSLGEPTRLINKQVFEQKTAFASHEQQAKLVIERGLWYAVFAFFLFGLALNLTPCVYPVIPMTVGFFVAQSQQKKRKIFLLASYYVVGIATAFSLLGLISSLAGRQWGFLFQSPWFVIVLTVIILCMAASMFGAFDITLPSSLMTPLGKSRQGAVGSFIMGLTVGLVIAPCAAGIVIGLVGVVAKLGIVARGTLLFFVMGLGLGIPYLFLGTFSGLLNSLPHSGVWMVWIRKLFGILLIGVAIYFLLPQANQASDQLAFYLGVLGIFGGLLLGFLEHGEGYAKRFNIVRGLLGLLLIIAGGLLVKHAIRPEAPKIDWIDYSDQPIASFQMKDRPVLVDFYADWCAACKVMDTRTFEDQRVVDKSRDFVMVRADCTSPNNAGSALAGQLKVSGLPTVVFIGVDGDELHDLRSVGFVGPAEMLEAMDRAIPRSAGLEP